MIVGQHVRIKLILHLNLLVIPIHMAIPHLAVETRINPGLEDFLLLSQHLAVASASSSIDHTLNGARLNEVIL